MVKLSILIFSFAIFSTPQCGIKTRIANSVIQNWLNYIPDFDFFNRKIVSRPLTGKTKCVSHRGVDIGKKTIQEHSLESFEYAVNTLFIKHIEFDVRHTLDGYPILSHDPTLQEFAVNKEDQSCPFKTPISQLTYEEINKKCKLDNGEEIPTLDKALQLFSSKGVHPFIELKDMPNIKTHDTVRKYYKNSPVTFISFQESALESFQSMNTHSPKIRNTRYLPLSNFFRSPSDNFDGANLHGCNQSTVRCWHDKKKYVSVWTVNDENKIREYAEKGVDFITTDFYSKCVEIVKNVQKRLKSLLHK